MSVCQNLRSQPQIGDEMGVFPLLVGGVLDAQQERRVDGDQGGGAVGNANVRPRSLVMVTGRPNRLRAAVAPSATMTAGFTIALSSSSQILQRSIS